VSRQSSIDDEDTDDAGLEAVFGGVWRAKGCRGCGQGPEDLARIDAIAVTAFLERRFASLLDNPEHSLRHRGPGRGSWSAMEPAAKVSDVLGAADTRLRDLLGEEALEPVPTATETRRSFASPQTIPAVFAALAENVRRLTATIAGATTEDWRRGEPDEGATPGELVWLALHDATHHLEDAELLLDAAWARSEAPRPAADIHSVRTPDETGSAVIRLI
jgi:hypothetical protein